jgi:hypothetical protein
MPSLPIQSLLSTPSIKIVDEMTKAVRWPKLKVRSVEISLDSENATVPLSNVQVNETSTYTKLLEGDLRTGKIIKPSHLKLTFWSPDPSTTESIIKSFRDPTLTFEVTSKSIISTSMVMVSLELTQTPDNLSATAITMEMEQATPPGENTDYDPAQPSDQPTRGVRIQTPVSLTSSVTALYNRVSTSLGF